MACLTLLLPSLLSNQIKDAEVIGLEPSSNLFQRKNNKGREAKISIDSDVLFINVLNAMIFHSMLLYRFMKCFCSEDRN